jgi:hypothetical protein
MGRSILLWLLGVPIPIIILLPQSQKHRVRPALKACNAISAVAGIGFDNVQSQTGNPTLAAMPNVGKNATCGGAGNVRKYYSDHRRHAAFYSWASQAPHSQTGGFNP